MTADQTTIPVLSVILLATLIRSAFGFGEALVAEVAPLLAALKGRGYQRAWTQFDRLPGWGASLRYTRTVEAGGRPVKVMLDLFVEAIPSAEVAGFRVLEPLVSLARYGRRHGSDPCFSVQVARGLLEEGIDPVGHPEMASDAPFLAGRAG